MNGFTAIRRGILEHIRDGQLCPYDLGIYLFLHLTAEWETGICFTNARSIAVQFGGRVSAKQIRQSLYRLRARRYINYRDGDGSRGSYNVLINKSRPTVGRHVGEQLNAFALGSLDAPVYEACNSDATVDGVTANRATTVVSPLQDIKTLQDLQDKHGRARKFVRPTLEEVRAYCQERGNQVNPQQWLDHYQANGWKVGKSAMKDWKAAVRTWEQNDIGAGNGKGRGLSERNRQAAERLEAINDADDRKAV